MKIEIVSQAKKEIFIGTLAALPIYAGGDMEIKLANGREQVTLCTGIGVPRDIFVLASSTSTTKILGKLVGIKVEKIE